MSRLMGLTHFSLDSSVFGLPSSDQRRQNLTGVLLPQLVVVGSIWRVVDEAQSLYVTLVVAVGHCDEESPQFPRHESRHEVCHRA